MGSKRTWNYREVLSAVYRRFAPDKVREIDRVLSHFAGREDELVATIEAKYSIAFQRDGTFVEVIDPDGDEDFSYETATDEGDDDDGDYDDEDDVYSETDLPSLSDEDFDEETLREAEFGGQSARQQQAALATQAVAMLQLRRANKPKRDSVSKRDSRRGRAPSSKRDSKSRSSRRLTESRPRGASSRSVAKTRGKRMAGVVAAAAAAAGSERGPAGSTGSASRRRSKPRAGTESARSRRGSTKASARGPGGKLYRKAGGLKANRGLGTVDVGLSARQKAELLSRPGTEVWVRDEELAWVMGTVADKGSSSGSVAVRVGGAGRRGATVVADPMDVEPVLAEKQPLAEVQDLTKLRALHEPALLQALQDRYAADKIYTFTGPILLAVNPFKTVNDLYSAKEAKKYMDASGGFTSTADGGLRTVDLPPHVYKLADEAYRAMRSRNGQNQSILISGESGAGKTETTRIALTYLSFVSTAGRRKAKKAYAADRVLRANPVLEAFGCAKTLRNNNSSRFGKFVQVMFDEHKGDMRGAYVETYLLEKSRVANVARGERWFHIIYELAAGASSEQKRRWHFPRSLKHCRYTGQSGTLLRDDIDDLAQFQTTLGAMQALNFSPSDVERVFKTVVAVLHLGNVDFVESTDKDGLPVVSVKDPREAVEPAADLLSIKPAKLLEVLTTRRIHAGRGEALVRSFDRAGAEDARDALAMNLYERLFGWVVWRTNLAIGMDDKQYESMLARQEQQRKYAERKQRRRGSSGPSDDGDDGAPAAGAAAGKKGRGGNQGSKLRGPPAAGDEIRASFGRAMAQALTASGIGGALASAAQQARAAGVGGAKKGVPKEWKPSHDSIIEILDIFGFEVFERNSLEQLLINHANESLQAQFSEFVFQFEQQEYTREGIDWTFVSFPDNADCLALVEGKPLGVLSLLDEECMLPRGSDGNLLQRMGAALPKRFPEHFLMSSQDRAAGAFTVRHFAGEVSYEVRGFTAKNRNEIRQEAVDAVRSSGDRLVSCLLPPDADAAAGGADMAAHFESMMGGGDQGDDKRRTRAQAAPDPLAHGVGGGRSGSLVGRLQRRTVSAHFRSQLGNAMALIRASDPHYVRCLKPSDTNKPGVFDRARVVSQLRYSGVLELVRVTRAGYPSRFPLAEFVERFSVLSFGAGAAARGKAAELAKKGSRKEHVVVAQQILDNAGVRHGDDFQIGKTKVFLRQATLAFLEMKKAERTYDCVVTIQRAFRRYRGTFRKRYAALVIQRNVRAFLVRRDVDVAFDQRAIAAEIIQTSPIFTRWLDDVMRRARRRRKRKAEQRKAWWKPPQWYTQNRELLFWAMPILAFYLLPTVLGFVRAALYNTPVVPIATFAVFAGTFLAGVGITSLEELQEAMRPAHGDDVAFAGGSRAARLRAERLARKQRKMKKKKRLQSLAKSEPAMPRSRVGRGTAAARSAAAAKLAEARPKVPRAQVSSKFMQRADSLRQQKAARAKRRDSPGFELPPVSGNSGGGAAARSAASPRFRGLYLGRK